MDSFSALDLDTQIGFISAGLLATGGLIGFLKKGSVPSLLAGGGTGALLAWGTETQRHDRKGLAVIVGISLALLLVMGKRFYRSKKVMPAGLVTVISIVLLARFGPKFLLR